MTSQPPEMIEHEWGIFERHRCEKNRKKYNCAKSYDGLGFVYLWYPSLNIVAQSRSIALDVENFQKKIPEYLGDFFNINDKGAFYHNWTCYEVVAKLLNIPIVILIKLNLMPIAQNVSHRIVTINYEDKETDVLMNSIKIDCWNVWATFGYKV